MPEACPWPQARRTAHAAPAPAPVFVVPLGAASGTVLAEDARSLTDLPATDIAAMDGWAVRGPAPWQVAGQVLAGQVPAPLDDGIAVGIATGALLPPGADGVLRREWGQVQDDRLTLGPECPGDLRYGGPVGADLRRAGEECLAGEVVLPAGARVTPAAVGLLAAAGLDEVAVRRVSAEVLVLGDELLAHGPARAGQVRDALGPLLAAWLPALGVRVIGPRRCADRAEDLAAALTGSRADVVVTTGSTARGPVDHLHRVLDAAGARLLVDGVAVRPGHPQLLALLPDGRPVVGLPGNPLAAVSGLLTLFQPALAGLLGQPLPATGEVVLMAGVPAGAHATRLVPVLAGVPQLHAGPAMLRGLAGADAMAVIPPGGAAAGQPVECLPLP